MEETLYNKMYKALSEPIDVLKIKQTRLAKAATNIAIQAQIDLLGKQNEKLGKQKKELKESLDKESIRDSRVYYNGKIEGIKLAIENNCQEINELEKNYHEN